MTSLSLSLSLSRILKICTNTICTPLSSIQSSYMLPHSILQQISKLKVPYIECFLEKTHTPYIKHAYDLHIECVKVNDTCVRPHTPHRANAVIYIASLSLTHTRACFPPTHLSSTCKVNESPHLKEIHRNKCTTHHIV